MSTAMASKSLTEFHVDETSCGPLCQHPQCWASNRRCDRGLPRVTEPVQSSWDSEENEGALPTLKIQNLLEDSGLDTLLGRFPTQRLRQSEAASSSPRHHRSSSAPAVEFDKQKQFPYTPYTSPLGVRSASARSIPSSIIGHQLPSKARSVEVRELFEVDELNNDWQRAFIPKHIYVWCPSKKAYERQLRQEKEQTSTENNDENDVSKSVTVKDMTDQMVPKAPKETTKRTKKMKKKPSRITPTGGRPYTHPSRSPLIQRRTLPVDMDESISHLLSLPRDILMDVLVHIQNSETLDRAKVQLLLSRLMPLIHFDQSQPGHRALSPTPLLASGILQNKKMSIHEGKQRLGDREHKTMIAQGPKNPFYLDDNVLSAMTTSTYTALTQQLPEEEAHKEPRETGRMARRQPLGPIQADSARYAGPLLQVSNLRNKPTSVSTKSLPPLIPGAKQTKPFDYTGAKSLDLTLGPLPSPDILSPEKPSTPRSEKASTLYVTLPSVPSPDRTDMLTPLQPYGRHPVSGIPARFATYMRDTPSPIASEDFQPLHAVSPSLSTGVPQAPLGTPATTFRHPSRQRSPSPTKQIYQGILEAHPKDVNTASRQGADPSNPEALGTIQEVRSAMTTSYQDTSAMGTSRMTSPGKHMTPVSTPWGNCTSFTAGQVSDRASRSPVPPVTPRPSTATPEFWPEVDERDFMNSPEKPREVVSSQTNDMTTPTAPPPSPEPQELKGEFEFAVNDMSKNAVTSLTPLVEEGEEEEDDEVEEAEENEEVVKDDGQVDNDVTKEDQDVDSRTDTEERQPDISVDEAHQPNNANSITKEIQNENSIDAAHNATGTADIIREDNIQESLDGTSSYTFEPAKRNKDISENQDEMNLDTIREGVDDTYMDKETAPPEEYLNLQETDQEMQHNEEGTTITDEATDVTVTIEDNASSDANQEDSITNQGQSVNMEATNENKEGKLDRAMPTNEGKAFIPQGEDISNPRAAIENTGDKLDTVLSTNQGEAHIEPDKDSEDLKAASENTGQNQNSDFSANNDQALIAQGEDSDLPKASNGNTGEKKDSDLSTNEGQALIASDKEQTDSGNVHSGVDNDPTGTEGQTTNVAEQENVSREKGKNRDAQNGEDLEPIKEDADN